MVPSVEALLLRGSIDQVGAGRNVSQEQTILRWLLRERRMHVDKAREGFSGGFSCSFRYDGSLVL